MDTKPALRLETLERRDTPAFTALPTFTAAISQPSVLASADFNGDNFADIAVGNPVSPGEQPYIGIALGKGDGTFVEIQKLIDPALITQPRSIAVADLNADGHPDLVVACFSGTDTGSLVVYLGQADGSFNAAPSFQDGFPAIAVGIGDFTGDGIPDIVSLNPDTISVVGGYEILSGNGTGGFTRVNTQSNLPFDVNRVVVGDFDGDNKKDFIALDKQDRLLYTFFGDGTGNFTLPATGVANLNFAPSDIAAGDFDGDGLLDFVISSDAGVTFHRNLGNQQFDLTGTNIFTISGTTPSRLAAADVNLDGVADIVASDQTSVRVFYGSFGKGFTEDPSSPLPFAGNTFFTDVAIRDANGDGPPDVIIVRREGSTITGSNGTVFLNLAPVATFTNVAANPNPGIAGTPTTLTATVQFPGNPFPFGVKPGGTVAFDVDNVFFGNGNLQNGVATLPANIPVGTHVITARFPGDARFTASLGEATVTILPAGGGTTYEFEVTGLPTLPGLGSDRVASANFTGDLVRDIVLGSGPGRSAELSIVDGKSRTEIANLQPFGPDFTGGLMVAAGDIDGDGRDDVAVAADIGGGPRITLYLNRNGVLEATNNFFALDENFRGGLRIALADIDGDHHADLIVVGGPGAGPRVATYDGTTLTEFQTPQRLFDDFFAMDPDTRLGLFVAAGDLDGDGIAEIAVSSDFGGGPRILIFNGESLLDNDPECIADFYAGDPNSRGGARIAIRDVSPSVEGFDLELIVGDGPTAGSSVRVYSGYAAASGATPSPLVTSELLPGYFGGVFVA